ncbi:conserved hypothetical protein [Actinobaculum suis]|uniref:Lysylphosphatidylglycerol synthase transmembrane domain-containing protein n=1 Tax=Actinobaculum suis TaxID=1657 RepID=A0A1G7D028_9ACTO|nr:lysylphosphatidylglycerol synthase transmembrane domain-containing protein [Actinobaculum suis]MDY5152809.1 lysylphosphatidylglycerol synthase transmembrane domain-containing protein [Actinobaculum suis]SDE45054.1 conserved hypothetical protein [Actinobaculum suis]
MHTEAGDSRLNPARAGFTKKPAAGFSALTPETAQETAPEGASENSPETAPAPRPATKVLLVDAIARWQRRPANLVRGIIATLGVITVVLISLYGFSSTVAVTNDVANAAADVLRTVLFMPVNVLEGIISLVLPLWIILELLWNRRWRALATAAVAVAGSVATCYAGLWLFRHYLPYAAVTEAFSKTLNEQATIGILPYVSVISVLLTVAGQFNQSRTARWGWWLLGIVVMLSILQGMQSLTGALFTILVGVAAACYALFAIGDAPQRAVGKAAVALVRRAGLDAVRIIRVDNIDDPLHAWEITSNAPLGYADSATFSGISRVLSGTAKTSSPAAKAAAAPAGAEKWAEGTAPAGATAKASAGAEGAAERTAASAGAAVAAEGNISVSPAQVAAGPALTTDATQVTEVEAALVPAPIPTQTLDIDAPSLAAQTRARYNPPITDTNSRNYVAELTDGSARFLTFIDSDREIVGRLAAAWQRIFLKASTRRTGSNIVETAERTLLMEREAAAIGAAPDRHPHAAGGNYSMVLSFDLAPRAATTPGSEPGSEPGRTSASAPCEPGRASASASGGSTATGVETAGTATGVETATAPGELGNAIPLAALAAEEIPDSALDDVWRALRTAHHAGISHQDVRASTVLVSGRHGYLIHWRNGSIASSELSRQIDLSQALTMMASAVGIERALASAQRMLSEQQLSSIAPVLQRAIIPQETLRAFQDRKDLQRLRDSLTKEIPQAATSSGPQLTRFSLRTIITAFIGAAALFILLGSINFNELLETIRTANFWWALAALAAGFLAFLGAGIVLRAYTAENLKLSEVTLVQVAAGVVGLVMPAGIGPAALNLRYLQKNKVPTAVAVATVTLVQVAQFVATVILLLVLALATGDFGGISLPSGSGLLTFLAVVGAVAAVLTIRPLRQWIIKKIRPTVQQIWPRIVWLATHPSRIATGFGGSVLQTASLVAAFGFSLAAFGETLPITTLAITYLVSNSVGSIVPSPGGIGPVEAALTGGLVVAGIPYSVAFSTAMLYRLTTFWIRVPVGWVALRVLQKKDII